MENNIIYLWNYKNDDWRWLPFELSTAAATAELEKQGILIGNEVNFGERVCISRNCYIGSNVDIGDHSYIGDYTCIYSDTILGNNNSIGMRCIIGGTAKSGDNVCIKNYISIGYKTKIGSRVRIDNSVSIGDYVSVDGNVRINAGSCIGNHAKIEKNPITIYITGSRFPVSYWGEDRIDIGCQSNSIDGWLTNGIGIADEYMFTTEQKVEYRGYIELIKSIHRPLKSF
jgi:acyl-[acyl carrier protein]--UDP-N-acetylglucosamine O-acyltransferase